MNSIFFSLVISACTTEKSLDGANPSKNCSQQDTSGDGIDSNCDGMDGIDFDQDGYASFASGGEDCNDNDANTHPQALEICDSIDNNCNGFADDEDENLEITSTKTWYADTDNDGFGSTTTIQTCIMPDGYTDNNEDCDDSNPDIHPQALEICDSIDNNCDGLIDDEDPLQDISSTSTWFVDFDGDGQGSIASSLQSCVAPTDYVDNAMDCDDADEFIYFGNASNESTLGCYIDNDHDGFGDSNSQSTSISSGTDCDDALTYINPMATEIPGDGIDQDCDGNDSLIQMPDFSLLDTNPYSATFGQTISVRDQLQRISGWYFIKAT